MLNQESLEYIVGLDKSGVEDHRGYDFFVNSKSAKLLEFPNVETVKAFSITQLLNALKADSLDAEEKRLLNVVNFDHVEVIDPVLNNNDKIDVYSRSDFSQIYQSFPFGQRLDQENFIINLMSKFEDTPEREDLLGLVGSIKAEDVRTNTDDGYSQVASVKAGVSLVAEKKIKNLWKLKTFKTFPEVEQPTIPYILRLHEGRGSAPTFALYDCDGGAWKVQVAKAIREFCSNWLKSEGLAEKVTVL